MIWTAVASLVGNIFGGVNESYQKRQQRKADKEQRADELEKAIHDKKVEKVKSDDASDNLMDQKSSDRKINSWADEYLLILTTAPAVILFFEPVLWVFITDVPYQKGMLQQGVIEGFEALKLAPEYWWIALAGIFIDVFGFRRMARLVLENTIAKKLGINK